MPYSIAIDGPAGAGKSTIAKKIAQKYDILYLSTGELYRSLGYACLKFNLDPFNKSIIEFLPFLLNLEYKIKNDKNGKILQIFLNKEDITSYLHNKEVSDITPIIASYPNIRNHIRSVQRKFAKENDIVMEGRDIGTVVLPNATYKFYLDASIETRAMHRYTELLKTNPNTDFQSVLLSIQKRDYLDKNREHSPLVCPKDAIYIDTSNKDILQVTDELCSHLNLNTQHQFNY